MKKTNHRLPFSLCSEDFVPFHFTGDISEVKPSPRPRSCPRGHGAVGPLVTGCDAVPREQACCSLVFHLSELASWTSRLPASEGCSDANSGRWACLDLPASQEEGQSRLGPSSAAEMNWGSDSNPIRPLTNENCLYTIAMARQQNSKLQASWKQIESGILEPGESLDEVGGREERLVGKIGHSQAHRDLIPVATLGAE